VFRADDNDINL